MSEKKNILLIPSNPPGTKKIESLATEFSHIQDFCNNKFNITILRNPRVNDILKKFPLFGESKEYYILHFSGHGNETGVYLYDLIRRNKKLYKDEMFVQLFQKKTPQILILNSCSSNEVVKKLYDKIPYIIATQANLPSEIATTFSYEFYQQISEHDNVKAAFKEAVRLTSSNGSDEDLFILKENEELIKKIAPDSTNKRNLYELPPDLHHDCNRGDWHNKIIQYSKHKFDTPKIIILYGASNHQPESLVSKFKNEKEDSISSIKKFELGSNLPSILPSLEKFFADEKEKEKYIVAELVINTISHGLNKKDFKSLVKGIIELKFESSKKAYVFITLSYSTSFWKKNKIRLFIFFYNLFQRFRGNCLILKEVESIHKAEVVDFFENYHRRQNKNILTREDCISIKNEFSQRKQKKFTMSAIYNAIEGHYYNKK